jgi:hypothetical protein
MDYCIMKPVLRNLSLDFSDTDFADLAVEAIAPNIREWLQLQPGVPMTNDEVMELMASKITSWNVEAKDSTKILPISVETIEELPYDLVLAIFAAYSEATRGVKKELGKDSMNGDRAMEESLPMDV